jgi:ABC-2 type transport system permease protein
MLKAIALFELRSRFTVLSTWVYIGIFFLAAFVWMIASGGIFDGGSVSYGSAKTHINSPFALSATVSVLGMFGLTIMAAVMGRAVQNDFEHRTHHFFFTSPITKFQYLGGRFVGALAVIVIVFSSIGLGAFLGTLLPAISADRLGPNELLNYLWPFLVVLLPNAIFIGGVFFMLAALTRKMLPVYVGSVTLLLGYLISLRLIGDLDNRTLAAMVDPFGTTAISRVVEYWTIDERNTRLVPLEGVFLWNRLMWLGVAAAAIAFCYSRFGFAQFSGELARNAPREREVETKSLAEAVNEPVRERLVLSPEDPDGLAMLPQMVWLNFIETVKNIYFGVLVFAGLLFVLFIGLTIGNLYGTQTWPVTYMVVESFTGGFLLFMLIIITFYAGELTWRERDQRVDQIIDTTSLPTWLPFVSKLLALMLVPVVLQAALMFGGVVMQLGKGYTHIEWSVYLQLMFGTVLLDYWVLCAMSMAVHAIVNNKYLGHFLVIGYYFFISFAALMGFEHNLYKFGVAPPVPYSDMNGFGHFVWRQLAFQAYWAACAGLLLTIGYLFWQRGGAQSLKDRIRTARQRVSRRVVACFAIFGSLFLLLGAFIFYNTNVLNEYENTATVEKRKADYEKTYKFVESEPLLKATSVELNVDIYPKTKDVRIGGRYALVNKTDKPIDTVHIDFLLADLVDVEKLAFNVPAKLIKEDARLGVRRFKLQQAVNPGEGIQLDFVAAKLRKGFVNGVERASVVDNGSFINGFEVMPLLGYQERVELTQDKDRKKYGLEIKERKRDRDDPIGIARNDVSAFADFVSFEAIVSTDEDQIAVAPGRLEREWKDDKGRRFFHYRMDSPVLNFYAFQSARYDVKREIWKGPNGDVALEIYHHPTHAFNLQRMMDSSRATLAYLSETIAPYPHSQFRIVEFPRYGGFAQSFPGTVPYSEAVGFIARVREDDEKDIDYPYYITAHEAAHQWWGHQVVGADVQGADMISETLAQYTALMVMKAKYSNAKMQRFLAYELDRYFTGRAREQKKEQPIARSESQPYIHYYKGGLAMFALQDYIGEANVNKALRNFHAEFAMKGPPYPTSVNLLKHLRAVTPPQYQYFIDDVFENIIVYENRVTRATWKALPDGKYEVSFKTISKKRKADNLGKEQDVALADWIDIGVLDDKGVPLFLEKRKIEKEENEFVVVVDKVPARAGIDPLNKLVDRGRRDNTTSIEEKR